MPTFSCDTSNNTVAEVSIVEIRTICGGFAFCAIVRSWSTKSVYTSIPDGAGDVVRTWGSVLQWSEAATSSRRIAGVCQTFGVLVGRAGDDSRGVYDATAVLTNQRSIAEIVVIGTQAVFIRDTGAVVPRSHAQSPGTLIFRRAGIPVIAGLAVGKRGAACLCIATFRRAGVAIIAVQ